MSDLHRARARAEEFAHAVDREPRHSSRPSDDPELRTAVELVGRLRTAGAVVPRPEFTAELRHRLLEQAAARTPTTPTVVDSSPDTPDDPPREDDDAPVTEIRRHRRRLRLVAGTAALVLLGGGIGSAAAAQQAMPGDTLYGMKRGIENVSLNASVGDDSRGRRELEHAMTRLSEIRALVDSGGDVATIDSTLDDFSIQARRGVSRLVASYQQDSDAGSITAVTTFITDARQTIGELAPALPPESLKSAVEALVTIEQLAQHALSACPKCAEPAPARTTDQTTVPTPGMEPRQDPGKTVAEPPLKPSAGPSTSTSPGQRPSTSVVDKTTALPPTILSNPSAPTSSSPSQPPLVTPSTPAWSWPLPTLSLPLPSLPLLPLFPPPSG